MEKIYARHLVKISGKMFSKTLRPLPEWLGGRKREMLLEKRRNRYKQISPAPKVLNSEKLKAEESSRLS